jgi:hypothetical protein
MQIAIGVSYLPARRRSARDSYVHSVVPYTQGELESWAGQGGLVGGDVTCVGRERGRSGGMSGGMSARGVLALLVHAAALVAVRGQGGATMIGGRPPAAVVTEQCNVRTPSQLSPSMMLCFAIGGHVAVSWC